MNKVVLIGRLTKDTELRFTQSNKAVVNLDLAVNRDYKNAEGNYDTDFINCQAWGKTAELINKYCKKGDLIAVEGNIRVDKYQDDSGNNKYKTYVLVSNIQFLSTKLNEEKKSSDFEEQPKGNEDIFREFGDSIEITDEDIAF